MTQEETALLQLIRNSQFDSPIDFSWDDIDMSKLYKEASQQSVLGLIAPLIPAEHSDDNWRKFLPTFSAVSFSTASMFAPTVETQFVCWCFVRDNN